MKSVSPDEYLEELNTRLRFHPGYKSGMRFVRGLGVGIGFDWEPKGNLHPFSEVSIAVRKEFFIPGRTR